MPESGPDHAAAQHAAQQAEARLGRQFNSIALLRLVCFVLLAIAGAGAIATPGIMPVVAVVGLGVAFLGLAFWHANVDHERRLARLRATYHQRGLDRMAGDWDHGQADGSALLPAQHAYANDLDLVGERGLYQLLNTAGSDQGRQILADWLFTEQPDPAAVRRRTELVRSLSQEHAWRAELAVIANDDHARKRGDDDLVGNWLARRAAGEGGSWRSLVPVVWGLRLVALGALVAAGLYLGGNGLVLTGLLAAMLLWPVDMKAVACGVGDPDGARRRAHAQAMALRHLATIEGAHPDLVRLRERAAAGAEGLGALARVLDRQAKRANALRALLGAVLLVEWQYLAGLEAWAERWGDQRAEWLQILGEGEGLACLATYAAEQAGAWAEVLSDDESLMFAAEDLAHPLLPVDRRVGNQVSVERGQVLLLTGANASGKSTFIRSICLAVILARLGTPVPAASCRLQLLDLATVMRVQDDLLAGKSRFQAEVERLKGMLDHLGAGTIPVCLALDEILGGTNSRERHLGTKAVLDHARGGRGIVLVSTHDLELADLAEAEPERFLLAHFADRAALGETPADGADMVFDYRLRPGVLQSTNALRVMKAYGLPVPEGWLSSVAADSATAEAESS